MVQGNLAGVRVVRSFALETREFHRFQAANGTYLDASLALARLRGSMFPILGMTAAIGSLVLFWYGGQMLLDGPEKGGLSKGDFFAFWSAMGRMTWPMIALGFSLSIIQRGRAGYARLEEEIFRHRPSRRSRRRSSSRASDDRRDPPGKGPLPRLRRPKGARRRRFRGEGRGVARDRGADGVRQVDPRDAPRPPPPDAARHRSAGGIRRLRSAARLGAPHDRLCAAGCVSLLDHRRAEHRLRVRRP